MQKKIKEMTPEGAFLRLSALCARGEHCQYDMLEKMQRWGMDDESQAQVMARLVEGRYIDDERFAHAYVHDKVTYDRWGRKKVEQALRLKRIDRSIIQSVLEEIDDSQYEDTLRDMLQQKRRTVKARNDYELKMKLMKWAVGRGYTLNVVRRCIDRMPDMDIDETDGSEFLD